MQRMFFAAWPNEQQVEHLLEIQDQLEVESGRLIAPENFHITLLFLGDVSASAEDCIVSQCNFSNIGNIDLTLSEIGYFPKSQILWYGPIEIPQPLTSLHRQLRGQAHHCQLRSIAKKFVPHVSLVRRCTFPSMEIVTRPLGWQISEFHLVSSVRHSDGARYEIVETFPLSACS